MSDEVHSDALEGTETREEIKQLAEISASKSQASTSQNEVLLDIRDEALLEYIRRLEEELPATERQRFRLKGKNGVDIKRIPEIMQRNVNFEKYFKPKKWEIGPIRDPHSSKYHIKPKLVALFISVNGRARVNIFRNFKTNMHGIKACFDEAMSSLFEEKELIRWLFLEGCAMLGFIHCYVNQLLKEVGIRDDEARDIERDLLLLENQIPFRVLEVLIGSGTDQENLKGSLVKFIYLICRGTLPGCSAVDLCEYLEKYCFSPEKKKNQKAFHLLDVFREAILFNPPSFNLFGLLLTVIRGTFSILCSCGCLAISYFLQCFKPEPHYTIISLFTTAKEFFFTVHELKAAGITFKPSHSLTTVSFRYLFFFRPQLMLPTLIVDDSTASKLLNLAAYEMCLSKSHPNQKSWVYSYMNLLYLLINKEQDVKDLIEADILRNSLGEDIAVADLIKLIGSEGITPPKDAYKGVKLKLEKHYKKKWRRKCAIWMEQGYVDHFHSPWTILALFATTTVLLLTAIQTWYAINPKK